jgi:hypothetical protein
VGHHKRADGDEWMMQELRWAILVFCFFGLMLLNYALEYPEVCIHVDGQNSAGQGCITGNEIRLENFSLVSLFFLSIFGCELWWFCDGDSRD